LRPALAGQELLSGNEGIYSINLLANPLLTVSGTLSLAQYPKLAGGLAELGISLNYVDLWLAPFLAPFLACGAKEELRSSQSPK